MEEKLDSAIKEIKYKNENKFINNDDNKNNKII